ncbi:T9SS type B sorting domain-containing protein [Flavobacterium sp. 7A]|uniref:T9SS type B sorting domain-containing protein n=1 Tax=Flavobacterium sp. 7A TaxID=2940571 RepID=UPI002226860F|nr:T9SS type B sorting domain-containing protein [Flavobacterium sp. 7A]MCW2121044.1 gliding motility-associated-like protein [Flavobacterium sp. 7A]
MFLFYSKINIFTALLILTFLSVYSQNVKVEPTFTFLNSTLKTYTVADLRVIELPTGATYTWYDVLTGGTALPNNTRLVSGTIYYLETSPKAAIGTRLETIVYEFKPILTADKTTNICNGETVKITATGILSNEQFEVENTNDQGLKLTKVIEYGNSNYYVKIQPTSMTWEEANTLINNIPGASMYIINSKVEEKVVYDGLLSKGLAKGSFDDGIAYWLGLKQYANAIDFTDTRTQGGWYWIDGSPLTYNNWSTNEPNDYHQLAGTNYVLYDGGGFINDEDYGQFEFQNRGIKWNDAPNSSTDRNSYPIFEFTVSTELQWYQLNTTTNSFESMPGQTKAELSVVTKSGVEKFRLDLILNGTVLSLPYEISKIEPKVYPISAQLTTLCATGTDATTLKETAVFDTSTFESTLIGSQTDVTVSYQDAAGNTLSSLLPDSFTSSTQTITVKVANTATPSCFITTTIPFIVVPTIKIKSVEIKDLSTINSVTVELENNLGKNVYSINGSTGPFQESNYFSPVAPGKYEIYVKDINECNYDSQVIYVVGAPQFFTPNGDGYNDYWNIKGLDNTLLPNAIITIYDRYGKFLKKISPLDLGWDGTYTGKQLPATDYWYTIQLEDGREAKGHFSLKR